MAPGPRKKGSYKRVTGDSHQANQNDKKNNETEKVEIIKDEIALDANNVEDKKYNKRSIKSNWDRYEELPNDPFADKMRGNDFEVILNLSGGSGSQLQLQDEKDWDDAAIDDKNITLDLKKIIHAMKCVPYHERLHLPENIFDEQQISKFISNAEYCQKLYKPNLESSVENLSKRFVSDLNIIENPEFSLDSEETLTKPQAIENKTENIIESLTSNLHLKPEIKDKNQTEKTFIIQESSKENELSSISFLKPQTKEKEHSLKASVIGDTSKEDDELDFLLSLNISLNEPKSEVSEPNSVASKVANVDDWLNSLLD